MKNKDNILSKGRNALLATGLAVALGGCVGGSSNVRDFCDTVENFGVPTGIYGTCEDARARVRQLDAERRAASREANTVHYNINGISGEMHKNEEVTYNGKKYSIYNLSSRNATISPLNDSGEYYDRSKSITVPIEELDMFKR